MPVKPAALVEAVVASSVTAVIAHALKYSPDQPRVPAGQAGGGEFGEGGGGKPFMGGRIGADGQWEAVPRDKVEIGDFGKVTTSREFPTDWRPISDPADRAAMMWQGNMEANSLVHMGIDDRLAGQTFNVVQHDGGQHWSRGVRDAVTELTEDDGNTPLNKDVNATARFVIDQVRNGDPTKDYLMRGTAMSPKAVGALKVGDSIKFGPSSFTSSSNMALVDHSIERATAAAVMSQPVTFALSPGARAWDVNKTTSTTIPMGTQGEARGAYSQLEGLRSMDEYVTGGTFRIDSVIKDATGRTNVAITQTANI